MIQELLGQTNFVGRDGFYWWMGQVETQKGSQPKKSDDRYKVRIVGQHLKDCNAVPYDDLPWAIVMMPATAPRREGNTDFQSVKYKAGDWVVGFFLDGVHGQQPVIMGSIGQQYNSTTQIQKDKPEGDCLAFTTFADKNLNPSTGAAATEAEKQKAGQPADYKAPPNSSNETASAILLATKCCNSETNPAGEHFCVEVSDAKCDSGTNDKSKFQTILSELFFNIQTSGGQFGNKIVSKYTGNLYNYIDITQGYVNKTIRVATSVVARVKGEIFAFIKQGAKAIIEFLLTEEVPDPTQPDKFVGPYADPKEAVKPAKKKVGRLRGITKWINDQLKKINCTMEDLDKRLQDFIEKLIFDALNKVFNAARCWVDKIVNSILNQIIKFLEDALNIILGPLQALLTIIANPLNILGAALAKIFDLLGITCGGPGNKCASEKQLKDCSGSCGKTEQKKNFLDDLIKAIEDKNLDTAAGNCSDYKYIPDVAPTIVNVVGGTTDPTGYTGSEPVVLPPESTDKTLSPSTFTNTSPPTTGTRIPYTPNELQELTTPTLRTVSTPATSPSLALFNVLDLDNNTTNIPLRIFGGTNIQRTDVTLNGQDTSTINSYDVFGFNFGNKNKIVVSGSSNVSYEPIDVTTEQITYTLLMDKTMVFKGDSITFTLVANGGVVENATVFNYAMFGANITSNVFSDNTTVGTMTMYNNVATKTITVVDDSYFTAPEIVSFNVLEASVSRSFTIVPGTTTTPTQQTITPAFNPPVIGTPEVCDDGRIMDIPIIDRGDRYLSPPFVIIEGTGYGASAIAVLDAEGYLNKIQINSSGIGYAPNRTRNNCVVDKVVLVNPGIGYYREPTVYVNGKSNVVKAIIDENTGFVKGFDVIDKTQTFGCTPRVEIFGGNGLGAKALPIMVCRDDVKHSQFVQEIAPSGSDNVVDCP